MYDKDIAYPEWAELVLGIENENSKVWKKEESIVGTSNKYKLKKYINLNYLY